MKRLWLLYGALGLCVGCAADGDKGSWDAAVKDWQGDNMKMTNTFSMPERIESHPIQPPSCDW
jgi:hypothetical protein